ncbi:hypothetical protein AMAG_12648 [Allomyces macrogynus ATCC 38327]|uniref:Cyclin n=1 Tax=Allomyces macrogynus (strain ATCC 38327) TaxID=578462 RepID=A0A0L0T162_ALLM3|nr:hypothetical protein AMAG_12648 [Allomyces macrogynus ATCC 38327]|eukprot:KNE68471.1 hypothetical protein AMAG_12648 [Allomyces macrogynus ATCC 38327]
MASNPAPQTTDAPPPADPAGATAALAVSPEAAPAVAASLMAQIDALVTPPEAAHVLATLLQHICTTNDRLAVHELGQLHAALIHQAAAARAAAADGGPPTPPPYHPLPQVHATFTTVTRFHARTPPAISVAAFLARIVRYAPCPTAVLLAVLMYLDRLAHRPSQALVVTTANVHRLLITAVMVATKYWSDVFYTNAHYAKVGGLHVAQLNRLELDFLALLDFNLALDPNEFVRYADRLHVHAAAAAATRDATQAAAAAAAAAATNVAEPPAAPVARPPPTVPVPAVVPTPAPSPQTHQPVPLASSSTSSDTLQGPAPARQRQISDLDLHSDVDDDDPSLTAAQRAALAQLRTVSIHEDKDEDVVMDEAETETAAPTRAAEWSPILAAGAVARTRASSSTAAGSSSSSSTGWIATAAPRLARKRSSARRPTAAAAGAAAGSRPRASPQPVAAVASPVVFPVA